MNESADDTFASDLPALDVEIDGLDENRNFPSSASNSADHSGESARKVGYYDRKLENRLRKYEAYLKKHENINRIDYESQVRVGFDLCVRLLRIILELFVLEILNSFCLLAMVGLKTTYPSRF